MGVQIEGPPRSKLIHRRLGKDGMEGTAGEYSSEVISIQRYLCMLSGL